MYVYVYAVSCYLVKHVELDVAKCFIVESTQGNANYHFLFSNNKKGGEYR